MIDRVEARFDITPERLIGDTAYGSVPMLAWMVGEKGIEPHVPLWDKTQRPDDTLSSTDFEWDGAANEYRCPEGHALRSERRPFKKARTHITQANTIIYRASEMVGRSHSAARAAYFQFKFTRTKISLPIPIAQQALPQSHGQRCSYTHREWH